MSLQASAQCDMYQCYMKSVAYRADDAQRYAREALDYAYKAYMASTIKDVKMYAKKAMNAAENTQSKAEDIRLNASIASYSPCKCLGDSEDYAANAEDYADEVEYYAKEAYEYAMKAYNSENLNEAKEYASKARYPAGTAAREADYAEDEGDKGATKCN